MGHPYTGIPYIGIPYIGIPYIGDPYIGDPYIGDPYIGVGGRTPHGMRISCVSSGAASAILSSVSESVSASR